MSLDGYFDPETLPVIRYLKKGNTATVWLAELDNRPVVVKRYNAKSYLGSVLQLFKRSRARISWMNAHLLRFLHIPTPMPLLYRDERRGFLKRTSYFMCDFIEGEPAHLYIATHGISENLLLALKELFECMRWFRLCQSDLKASNVIIHNEVEPYLIDLDSIEHFRTYWQFNRRWVKSWQRWLDNWEGNNRLILNDHVSCSR